MEYIHIDADKVGESLLAVQLCMEGNKFWVPKSLLKYEGDSILIVDYFWNKKKEELNQIHGNVMIDGFASLVKKENAIGIKIEMQEYIGKQQVYRWVWFPLNVIAGYTDESITIKRWIWEEKKNAILASIPEQFRRDNRLSVAVTESQ